MPNASYKAIGSFNSGTGNVVLTPPSHVAGDILVVVAENQESVGITAPAGYAHISGSPQAQGSNVVTMNVMWRRATSNHMPNVTLPDPGNHINGVIFTVDDAVWFGNPIDVAQGSANNNASPSITGVSLSAVNELVGVFIATGADTATNQVNSVTNANLSGLAQRGQQSVIDGGGGGVYVGTGTKATTGATGTTSASLAGSQAWAAIVAAFKNDLGSSYAGPEIEAQGTPNNGTTSPVTYALPAGYDVDDLLFLVTESTNSGGTGDITGAAGWTKWLTSASTSNFTVATVYVKRATSSSETDPTVPGATNHQSGYTFSVTGALDTGDFWDQTPGTGTAFSATISLNGITTDDDNDLIISVFSTSQDSASDQFTLNNNDLNEFQELDQFGTTDGDGGGIGVWYGRQPTAGATGTVVGQQLSGVYWAGITFAIKVNHDIPEGSGSGIWSFAGDAVGERDPEASGSGTWAFAGTAVGEREPEATASGTWSFAGTAAGESDPQGSAAGSWAFQGAAAGESDPQGSATGSWAFTGAAEGESDPQGSATGSWSFTGAAEGESEPQGSAAGSWVFAGAAEGVREPVGDAVGSWAFEGEAEGEAPDDSPGEGSAVGTWSFVGSTSGVRAPKGSATGAWSFEGEAEGKREPEGAAAGSWVFQGAAEGERQPQGSAAGTFTFTGVATGSAVQGGTAVGSWSFTGAAAGAYTAKGSAAGGWIFSGDASGVRTPKGSATGATVFVGTALGVTARYGEAEGETLYVGTAEGSTAMSGTATGHVDWLGEAVGIAVVVPPEPTPETRTLHIFAEDRVTVVDAENRSTRIRKPDNLSTIERAPRRTVPRREPGVIV